MKRPLALVAFLALWWLLLAGAAFAQVAPLPEDDRFDQPVEFKTGADGESLATMLAALARAIGLTAVVENVPDKTIVYDIGDAKPFRQVWDIVMTLNDLDYVLLDNDVVVIGPSSTVDTLRSAHGDGGGEAAGGPLEQRFFRVNNDPEQVIAILRRAVPGVEVEALPGVQSVVVYGTQVQHDEVRSVLDQFDREVQAAPLEQRIYFLSNAKAADLAAVLQDTDLVVGGAPAAGADPAAAGVGAERGFSITADPRTNSIIVTATAAVQARLAEIIPQLDTPQKQVNVQVRIQEVSERTAQNLGLNVEAGLGSFAANVLDTGLSFIFNTAQSISSLNILAVLDTLETQGLSRRVDDSTLTVLNNETGRLQSGGRIEIQFPSSDGELATRTIEFGVIITVTPRISNDGRVIMEVTAEVSDIAVPLQEGGIPQRIDFTTREVSSTVTLAPGQTVLLGGLLQNQFSQTHKGVPILSSIPLIGGLFGSEVQSEDNTELLLVVNAQVIE